MSAFGEGRKLEEESKSILIPILRRWYPTLALLEHDKFGKELQQFGDAIGQSDDGARKRLFEFKAEEENKYGNFFFETWSNRSRCTLGWFPKLKSDLLIYHFLKDKIAYVMDVEVLLRWAFSGNSTDERICNFRLRQQDKRQQLNDTWGRCVPVGVIEKEVGFKHVIQHNEESETIPFPLPSEPTMNEPQPFKRCEICEQSAEAIWHCPKCNHH